MSLNDFFAGGVYLRPVGLPDCFPMPGLPHGCKPPPQLTMQHPCGAGPPPKPRSMAAVSPLHQVAVPPQANHLAGAYEPSPAALNAFGPAVSAANRTSSFAAALRKLAKQAGDPIIGDKDLTQISPVSSPVLAQRSLTPKRNGGNVSGQPSMYLSSGGVNSNAHQITSYPSGSPPVVTIAPSRPHQAHTSDSRKLQVMDLSGLPQGNNTSGLSNGHLSDSLSLKLDAGGKSTTRTSTNEKWEDHHVSKSLPNSSASSQSRPHATIAPLPRPDDSLTSSRGFQPYRSADDIRTQMPHHLSPFEQHHQPSAYPYTPAFLPPPHIAHPAYRFEDPLFLDRYGLLRSPVMPFPGQSGIMASPAHFYPQSRYDLLAQSLSLSSAANNSLMHHERLKLEEERRLREKETELDQSRKREQERREKEQKEKEHREKEKESKRERSHREKAERNSNSHTDQQHLDHGRLANTSSSHSKRNEHSVSRNDAVVHTTVTTTATTNGHQPPSSSPVNNSSSAPLNLVVHPAPEQPRKETELWVPWQQHHHHHNPSSNNNNIINQVKDNHEETGNGVITYRHSAPVVPENYRISVSKENTSPEKFHSPYNLPFYGDKKHPNAEPNHVENESKKHMHHGNGNGKKFDTIHHHIAELSKKDTNAIVNNEWKHEKLQKACTNNHRKNVSEFKKLREESHQTHQRKQHHPTVNGVVKPVFHQAQIQDEGMHARLLETEKYRMSEYNNQHHMSVKSSIPQQSEKLLLPPSLMPSNFQMNGHDILSQKVYIEHSAAIPKQQQPVESVPVRSKLDKEAEDSKKKGKTDADGDDVPLGDFLIITKGPALKLDTNTKKMKFFQILGLTSQLKRKKIELDIYLKRRKILHEDQCHTILLEPEERVVTSEALWETSHELDRLSEKLRLDVSTEKLDFLRGLKLKPLTLANKEEQVRLNKLVLAERKHREQRLKMKPEKKNNKQSAIGTKQEKENAESKESLTNKKEKIGLKPKCTEKSSSQNVPAPGEQVPYTHTVESENAKENAGLNQPFRNDSTAKMLNSISKHRTKYSFKRGHSLKCEWKPPVLTLMPTNNHFKDRPTIIKKEIKTDYHSHTSTGTQVDLPFNGSKTKDKGQRSFHWPGLEVVTEAYYRHNKEQLREKEEIQERCNRLKTQQEDLKKEATTLNKSMAELLKLKRELDEKRNQYEKSIENLKQCMQISR